MSDIYSTARHRAWSITSQHLNAEHIREFVEAHAKPHQRVVGIIHDRDPGTETHGHVFFFDVRTARTEAAMKRKFPVPVQVRPFVHPGEKFGWARAARYCTHEHPDQQAQGKALYGDDEIIATPHWDWRKEVDDLNAYERVQPGQETKLSLVKRLKVRVLRRELKPDDIAHKWPSIYVENISLWERLWWEGMDLGYVRGQLRE